jgi:hypothetical protein
MVSRHHEIEILLRGLVKRCRNRDGSVSPDTYAWISAEEVQALIEAMQMVTEHESMSIDQKARRAAYNDKNRYGGAPKK